MNTSVFVDKLMYWRGGTWIKFDKGISNGILRIHCDQLLISADNKILETINMNGKVKGFYKGDAFILVICGSGSEIRKIKFRVKENVEQCSEILGKYFPVVCHGAAQNVTVALCKYRNMEEVIKYSMETVTKDDASFQIPENYTNFVKLCLLDPAFPQFVRETQNILDKF